MIHSKIIPTAVFYGVWMNNFYVTDFHINKIKMEKLFVKPKSCIYLQPNSFI